ncbi:hypothetical protein EXIGLDRAFT_764239 [Exidia glandulosa HHB12029]|uniref:Uncharacterized protein n=1 Tax=Exidia glandulosa HHB12029 TaxID=1314781 RepID=A0A166B3G9_EXIGL|nr:hypothetical protein EXIGLDRAFT_764239 [Exidia glandulosa HHB12029]
MAAIGHRHLSLHASDALEECALANVTWGMDLDGGEVVLNVSQVAATGDFRVALVETLVFTGHGDGIIWQLNVEGTYEYELELWWVATGDPSIRMGSAATTGITVDFAGAGSNGCGIRRPVADSEPIPTVTVAATSFPTSTEFSSAFPRPPRAGSSSHTVTFVAVGVSCFSALLLTGVAVVWFQRRKRRTRTDLSPLSAPAEEVASPAHAKQSLVQAAFGKETHVSDPAELVEPASQRDVDEIERLRAAVALLEEEAREWRVGELETLPSYESRSVTSGS